MSWHFSRALEAEFSGADSSDGEQSAPWRSIPTARDDSSSARMKGTCHHSPFGTMFVPSTDTRGEALLTSFLEASRARTSAPPGEALESAESAPGCGVNSRGSSKRCAPGTLSSRTHRGLELEGLSESSKTLPASGMTRRGECWERPTLAPPTIAGECGLLPTPAKTGMWPTPTTAMNATSPSMAKWPANQALRATTGGPLSADWAEWLMGWPIGWTACEPLETDKFRLWLRLHGAL